MPIHWIPAIARSAERSGATTVVRYEDFSSTLAPNPPPLEERILESPPQSALDPVGRTAAARRSSGSEVGFFARKNSTPLITPNPPIIRNDRV